MTDLEYMLFQSTKSRYTALLNEFEADDDLINQTFKNIKIEVEDRVIPLVKPPTASDAVGNAADHILTNPRVSVPPRPVTDDIEEAQRTSEQLQQFYQMWWNNVFSTCGDPLGRGKQQLVKGKIVLKKTLKWWMLPQMPERPTRRDRDRYKAALERAGRSTFLWDVQLIPKESVFEDPARPWDPDYVCEEYAISVRDAAKMFPQLVGKLGNSDPLSEVNYVEYWEKPYASSRGKFIQWVDGERVHEGDNPYCWEADYEVDGEPAYCGYVPYVIGASGWGDEGPSAKPEDRYVSIIRRARSILEAECRMLTSMDEYLKFYVFKPLLTKNIPADKSLQNVPGAVWSLQEGQEAAFMQPGDMPQGLLAGMGRVNAYADQTSKFSTLGGMPQRGVDTATEADQNIRNAATKLSAPINTLRRMIIQINAQVGQDIEKVLEAPVTIYGATGGGPSEVTIKPSDINGFYLTHVELETSDEAALNLRNARTWSDLAQRMPISFKTVMRMAGIMNGSQEMDERMLENIEQSPQVMQMLLQAVLQGQQAEMPTPQPQMPNAPTPETIDQQARAAAQVNMPERAFM